MSTGGSWRDRLADRWDQGGGHLAAALWWLAFLFYLAGGALGMIAFLTSPGHAPPPFAESHSNLKRIDLALLHVRPGLR